MNYSKILDLKTQIITLLQVETMIVEKRVKLEEECKKLEAEGSMEPTV